MAQLPSPKEAEVLTLLASKHEMYGLEMVNASVGLKRGTIYVTLSRMEEKGWISSHEDAVPTYPGIPRRLYKITGLGQRAFAARTTATAMLATDGLVPVGA